MSSTCPFVLESLEACCCCYLCQRRGFMNACPVFVHLCRMQLCRPENFCVKESHACSLIQLMCSNAHSPGLRYVHSTIILNACLTSRLVLHDPTQPHDPSWSSKENAPVIGETPVASRLQKKANRRMFLTSRKEICRYTIVV